MNPISFMMLQLMQLMELIETGTHVVKMAELYTGWFEVKNMKGKPGSSTVKHKLTSRSHFQNCCLII